MSYEWAGEYFTVLENGDFKNKKTGLIMSPRKTCCFLNFIFEPNSVWIPRKIEMWEEIEWRKQYQRQLEDKIHRLKRRVTELEKNQ